MRLEGKMKGRLFFFCMRDYEGYITSWCTLSHSFLRHSLLRCPQMLRCLQLHCGPKHFLLAINKHDLNFLLKHISKLGQLICTEKSAGECVLCVFFISFFPLSFKQFQVDGPGVN